VTTTSSISRTRR